MTTGRLYKLYNDIHCFHVAMTTTYAHLHKTFNKKWMPSLISVLRAVLLHRSHSILSSVHHHN